MNNQTAYDKWSGTYDSVENKTRDLEAKALRENITGKFRSVLEIGCGTGKNTVHLITLAERLCGADFSEEMLAQSRQKISSENIEFRLMDIREDWDFPADAFDLITCSLVLEHIEDLGFIFGQARKVLRPGGIIYLGELHPFKQLTGSKARFETGSGVFELRCFVHQISDYFAAAESNGFEFAGLREWFDENDETDFPRILTILFKKS